MVPFILAISLLSRWSGSLVVKYGPQLPLIIGPLIAASGYFLLGFQQIGGAYWTTFFGPIVIIGIGMAISVAPLTTTVMSSVSENRAGVASGVNNAVARTAGLIAIAVLGIVMLHLFDRELEKQSAELQLPKTVSEFVIAQHTKLAAIAVPQGDDSRTQQLFQKAIQQSFVLGFHRVTMVCALLALLAAGSAWTFLKATHTQLIR